MLVGFCEQKEVTKMTYFCKDCQRPASTKICNECQANRKQCANHPICTQTVPPSGEFDYCRFCACINQQCPNPKEAGYNICRGCLDTWERKQCYICLKKDADPPFSTCKPCNMIRKECIRCDKKQAFIHGSSNPPKFYKFCPNHKCKTPLCAEQRGQNTNDLCAKCVTKQLKHLCTKCHQHPTLKDGSNQCYLCNRDANKVVEPTCKRQGCTEKVKYSVKQKKYYDICHKCTCQNPFCGEVGRPDLNGFCGQPCIKCAADGCNRVAHTHKQSEWCAICYTRYDLHQEVRCKTCVNYTTNARTSQCQQCMDKVHEAKGEKRPTREWGASDSEHEQEQDFYEGDEGEDEQENQQESVAKKPMVMRV
jgi:hypothetical protein